MRVLYEEKEKPYIQTYSPESGELLIFDSGNSYRYKFKPYIDSSEYNEIYKHIEKGFESKGKAFWPEVKAFCKRISSDGMDGLLEAVYVIDKLKESSGNKTSGTFALLYTGPRNVLERFDGFEGIPYWKPVVYRLNSLAKSKLGRIVKQDYKDSNTDEDIIAWCKRNPMGYCLVGAVGCGNIMKFREDLMKYKIGRFKIEDSLHAEVDFGVTVSGKKLFGKLLLLLT